MAEVGGLLANHGLVTIIGSGGCGKTRLALQVAAEALGARADEAWFVDLSGLADPGLVPGAVMAAMGVQEVPDQAHTETLDGPARRPRRPGRAGQLRARPGRRLGAGRGAGAQLWAPGRAGHFPRAARGSRRGRLACAFRASSRARGAGPGGHRGPGRLRGGPAVHRPRPGRAAELRRHRRQRPGRGGHLPAPGRDPARHRAGGRPGAHDERRAHRRGPGRPVPPPGRRGAQRRAPPGDPAGVGGLELRAVCPSPSAPCCAGSRSSPAACRSTRPSR